MKNKFLKSFSTLVIIFVAYSTFAQKTIDQKLGEIDAYANKTLTEWKVPGFAIGIVKDDKIIFTKGYGVRELGKSEKIDENTLFAIASNSKAFTVAALAILVDEGKIKWDDRVTQYIPEFQMSDSWVTREMTIRDLLSHRSGLDTFSGDLLWYDTTYTSDEIIRRIRYVKPKTSFRSAFGYQNLMFITAAKVLERVSGKTWAQFVRERILTPTGMTHTTTSVKDLKDNYALPHNESGGKLRALPVGDVDNSWGACGLNSSVADLSKWLRLQLGRGTIDGKQIFSKARSGEMWSQNMFIGINPFPAKNAPTQMFSGYGLGWFLSDYYGKKMIAHSGGLDGMLSYTSLIPEENLGVVVLTNGEDPVFTIMRNKILDTFLNVENPRDWSAESLKRAADAKKATDAENARIDAARIINTKPTLLLKDYAGVYTSQMYGDVKISEENNQLVLRLVPAPNFVADLVPWNYDTFQIKWRDSVKYNFPRGWATFTIDKNGKADELKIDQPNNDFWFYELDLKRK